MDPGRREDGVRRDHDQGRRRIASDRVLAGDLRRLDPGWPEQGGRDAFLALGERHDITGIVHLAAGGLEVTDPMEFLRVNTGGLLNALEAARSWGVHRFAVASSIGVYAGRSETRWHEELALPTTTGTHPIPAFKKAVETLTMLGLADSSVQAVLLRIGTIWGPLGLPDSPFIPFPALINAVAKGQEPPTLYADDGGDRCYAPTPAWRSRSHFVIRGEERQLLRDFGEEFARYRSHVRRYL